MQTGIEKMRFDIAPSNRQLARQTWTIAITAIGVVVAAFAASAAWWNYFGQHHGWQRSPYEPWLMRDPATRGYLVGDDDFAASVGLVTGEQ